MGYLAKVVVPVVLSLLMLLALLSQQVSLVCILRLISKPDIDVETKHLTVFLLVLLPYLFGCIQLLWNTNFLNKSNIGHLPYWKDILLGVFISVLEGASVFLFTIEVAVSLPVFILLPLRYAVFGFPGVLEQWPWNEVHHSPADSCSRGRGHWTSSPAACSSDANRRVLSILALATPVFIGVVLHVGGSITLGQAFCLGLSLWGLSVAWSPKLVIRSLSAPGGLINTSRRIQLVYYVIKVLVVCLFLVIYAKTQWSSERISYYAITSFAGLQRSDINAAFMVNFMSGLISHGLSYAALAMCLPNAGICIPTIISTPAAVILCIAYFSPHLCRVEELQMFDSDITVYVATGVAAILWGVLFLVQYSDFGRRPTVLHTPYQVLFLHHGWNNVFLDQFLLLGFRADGFGRIPTTQVTTDQTKSKVFICTTMYREADYEIERALASYQRLSYSDMFNGVHLEAHVFMDNGCCGSVLQSFAQQLLALVDTTLGRKLQDGVCYSTPYGIQIQWTLRGGLPLFVHLKDPQKVKAKKRWSQAMYMFYIMQVRAKRLSERDKCTLQECDDVSQVPNVSLPKHMDNVSLSSKGHSSTTSGFVDGSSTNCTETSSINSSSTLGKINAGFEGDGVSSDLAQGRQLSSRDNNGIVATTEKPFQIDRENALLGSQKSETPMTSSCSPSNSSPHVAIETTDSGGTELGGIQTGRQASSADVNSHESHSVEIRNTDDAVAFEDPVWLDEQTYILATDADTEFQPLSVKEILDLCNGEKQIGSACGRIHPIGKTDRLVVWHQVFEYSSDFWNLKTTQNSIGSVMCSPGCFSLYRTTALKPLLQKYTSPTRTPFGVYVKDTGEDRWMTTLMMLEGWWIRFCPLSHNTTFCPDTFDEFLKQRRRWILSDFANGLIVVRNLRRLIRNNECFTLLFVAYQLLMLFTSITSVASAIFTMTAGLDLVFGVNYIGSTIGYSVLVIAYAVLCTKLNTKHQTYLTVGLTAISGFTFFAVIAWGVVILLGFWMEENSSTDQLFLQYFVLVVLTATVVLPASLHLPQANRAGYGIAYVFTFALVHCFLPVYSACNIVDQTWGTRDGNVAKKPKIPCVFSCMNKGDISSADNETEVVGAEVTMKELRPLYNSGHEGEKEELEFWNHLTRTILGPGVNVGLNKDKLSARLGPIRNKCVIGILVVNMLWLLIVSLFYAVVPVTFYNINVIGIIAGVLFGFCLSVQLTGLITCRADVLFRKLVSVLYADELPVWVSDRRGQTCW